MVQIFQNKHRRTHTYNSMNPQQELARKMSIHSIGGEKLHTSSDSKESLGRAGHLKTHMEASSKVRINACVQCQRSFGKAGNF